MEHDLEFLPYSFMNQLKTTERKYLESVAHDFHYLKGEYIFHAEQSDHSIYILVQGRVKISRTSLLGNELIQWFCLPGDIFGIAGENNLSNNVYAQSLTDCYALKIKKPVFNQLLLDHPRVALLVIDKLSERIHSLGDMVLYISSDSANERFIKLLQHLSKTYGQRGRDGIYIDIPTTHQDFADMIGSCRQTVSGIISSLKRDGIINVTRRGINIYKPQQLQQQISLGTN